MVASLITPVGCGGRLGTLTVQVRVAASPSGSAARISTTPAPFARAVTVTVPPETSTPTVFSPEAEAV